MENKERLKINIKSAGWGKGMLGGGGGGGGGGEVCKRNFTYDRIRVIQFVLGKTCGPKIFLVSVFVGVQNKEPFIFLNRLPFVFDR